MMLQRIQSSLLRLIAKYYLAQATVSVVQCKGLVIIWFFFSWIHCVPTYASISQAAKGMLLFQNMSDFHNVTVQVEGVGGINSVPCNSTGTQLDPWHHSRASTTWCLTVFSLTLLKGLSHTFHQACLEEVSSPLCLCQALLSNLTNPWILLHQSKPNNYLH